MRQLRAVTIAVLLFLPALAARGQNSGESVQVNVVEVPVTVTARNGEALRTLTAGSFELYDDGRHVPIEYFEKVDLHNAAAGDAAHPAATRNFLLLFDLENSSPGTIARAQEAAKQFVHSDLTPRDLVSIGTMTAERGVQLFTSFTSDRSLTLAAVDVLGTSPRFRSGDPLMLSRPEMATDAVTGAPTPVDPGATHRFSDAELRNRLKIQLASLERIAQTLNRLHGQKQIILLSEGFDARLVQGRDDVSAEQARQDMDTVLAGEAYKIDNDQRFGNPSSNNDLAQMGARFRRSDVVLHAIDIAGLRSDVNAASGYRKSSNQSLYLLTAATGGSVFPNVNDLRESFRRVLRQQEVIYVLGFTAHSGPTPGRFHTLRVKVRARGARVAHRVGYFEPDGESGDLEEALSLAEILMTDLPIDDVAVSLSATPIPGRDGNARVPVVVEIPGGRLLQGVTGATATATVYLYAFDEDNRVIDHIEQRVAVDLSEAGARLRESGIRYYATLRVPPSPAIAVKALVRVEESGRIGFARSDLRVPAFQGAVVLPPVMVSTPEKWLMLSGPSRGDTYPYPFAAGDVSYVPLAHPELHEDGEYKLALFLWQIPLEGLGLEPAVLRTDGSAVQPANVTVLGRTTADADGGAKLLLSFRPAGLKAGDYQLQLNVQPKSGTAAVVSTPFAVR